MWLGPFLDGLCVGRQGVSERPTHPAREEEIRVCVSKVRADGLLAHVGQAILVPRRMGLQESLLHGGGGVMSCDAPRHFFQWQTCTSPAMIEKHYGRYMRLGWAGRAR